MRLGVDELAHVCSPSGAAYLTFDQAQDRWPLPGELRHEWDLLLSELSLAGAPRAGGFGHPTPREMHSGVEALFSSAGRTPSDEQVRTRAARTGSSLGTCRHPSNLTITVGHLRDPRRSWLTRRRAEAAAVSRSRSVGGGACASASGLGPEAAVGEAGAAAWRVYGGWLRDRFAAADVEPPP